MKMLRVAMKLILTEENFVEHPHLFKGRLFIVQFQPDVLSDFLNGPVDKVFIQTGVLIAGNNDGTTNKVLVRVLPLPELKLDILKLNFMNQVLNAVVKNQSEVLFLPGVLQKRNRIRTVLQ